MVPCKGVGEGAGSGEEHEQSKRHGTTDPMPLLSNEVLPQTDQQRLGSWSDRTGASASVLEVDDAGSNRS